MGEQRWSPICGSIFFGFSCGLGPGRNQHQALDALWAELHWKGLVRELDADIKAFFDTVDHDWIWQLRFIEHRTVDSRVARLIRK